MIGNELLLLAAALVLLFALPLALLAWMAAQYAQMRQLANRLEGLEVGMRRLHERSTSRLEPEVEPTSESELESTAHLALPESEEPESTAEPEPEEPESTARAALLESSEPESMVEPSLEEPGSMVEQMVEPLIDPDFESSRIDAEDDRTANGEGTAP